MKYVKMLGLLAVAAATVMAFATSASATMTDGSGGQVTAIHAKNGGHISLTGSVTITCTESTVGGHITTNDANHVSGDITILTFGGCGTSTVTVIEKGTLTATDDGTNTATVYSTGAKVTVLLHSAILGTVHCTYVTNTVH